MLLVILLLGFALRLSGFFENISRHHAWRQTHVASNILYYIRNGVELGTRTFAKNEEYKLYDFPLYQQGVALISLVTHANPVQVGRAANILIYVVSSLIFWKILERLKIHPRLALLTLATIALSPFDAYYGRAVMVDNLSVLLAYVSVLSYLRWQAKANASPIDYGVMIASGVLSTLIKNPVYLVVTIGLITDVLARSRFQLLRVPRAFWAFLAVIFATVVGFHFYSTWLNVGSISTPESERLWFFGTLAQRLKLGNHVTILGHLGLSPMLALLLGFGVCHFLEHRCDTEPHRLLLPGFVLGALASVVIFFNLHVCHDYYQLPFVFPVAFFTAYLVDLVIEHAKNGATRGLLIASFVAVLFVTYKLQRPSTSTARELADAGEFVQKNTEPGSALLYANTRADWDPAPLYFADREGYNIGWNADTNAFEAFSGRIAWVASANTFQPVEGQSLRQIWEAASTRWNDGRSIYAFCAKSLPGCRTEAFATIGLTTKKETDEYLLLGRSDSRPASVSAR